MYTHNNDVLHFTTSSTSCHFVVKYKTTWHMSSWTNSQITENRTKPATNLHQNLYSVNNKCISSHFYDTWFDVSKHNSTTFGRMQTWSCLKVFHLATALLLQNRRYKSCYVLQRNYCVSCELLQRLGRVSCRSLERDVLQLANWNRVRWTVWPKGTTSTRSGRRRWSTERDAIPTL